MSGESGSKFSLKVGGMSRSYGNEQELVISPRPCTRTCIIIVAIAPV